MERTIVLGGHQWTVAETDLVLSRSREGSCVVRALRFETRGERLYLADFPSDWGGRSDAELMALRLTARPISDL